jgi:ethanolamine transporter EutH
MFDQIWPVFFARVAACGLRVERTRMAQGFSTFVKSLRNRA